MNNDVTVGVVAKPSHHLAGKLTQKVIDWLQEKGYHFVIDEHTLNSLSLRDIPEEAAVKRKDLSRLASPIVVMGGDGTLISVCHHPTHRPPVIVGVNLGTLGFLTEITTSELFSTLESVLAGQAQLSRRYLIQADVIRGGQTVETFTAVNDVVITKEALARIFSVKTYVNDEYAATSRGDGFIVATPGGSTAYSLAAGGSIVHPRVGALLLTPICPHSLTIRPLVLPGDVRIVLEVGADTRTEEVYLTIDGQEGMSLGGGDKVCVTTSSYSFLFAKSPCKNYYQVLGAKLKWAAG